MEAAREAGITFLDDARYDDETGTAPMPTGYSEVVFGELFARSGYARDRGRRGQQAVVGVLARPGRRSGRWTASLGRMGFEDLDLIYSSTLPRAPAARGRGRAGRRGCSAAGRARALGDRQLAGRGDSKRAGDLCDGRGVPQPCAAQLPYNLLHRDWVEGEAMRRALERTGASVVASAVLAGGALSGKYGSGGTGRLAEGAGSARTLAETARAAGELAALAREWGTAAAVLALAFALCEPTVGSVLFGATSPAQVRENCAAAEFAESLDADRRARLRSIGVP